MKTSIMPSIALLMLLLPCLISCSQDDRLHAITLAGDTMGTRYTVKLAGYEGADSLHPLIETELERINGIFSTWQADSEISRFNASLPGMEVLPSEDMRQVLAISKTVHQLTGGAFEITLGPLINLWGFGPGGINATSGNEVKIPTDDEIQQLLRQIGTDAIILDDFGLAKSRPLSIDLSAVAKGYAVDQLARLLESRQVPNYMVEVGGELRVKGTNAQGQAWQIAIENPVPGTREIYQVLPLVNTGMATSGDYRNFFEQDGKRFSHTLDPRTGRPVSHNLASVTVLHDSAAMADALATAFMVLGAEESLRLANANNWRILVIVRNQGLQTRTSTAMDAYLESL